MATSPADVFALFSGEVGPNDVVVHGEAESGTLAASGTASSGASMRPTSLAKGGTSGDYGKVKERLLLLPASERVKLSEAASAKAAMAALVGGSVVKATKAEERRANDARRRLSPLSFSLASTSLVRLRSAAARRRTAWSHSTPRAALADLLRLVHKWAPSVSKEPLKAFVPRSYGYGRSAYIRSILTDFRRHSNGQLIAMGVLEKRALQEVGGILGRDSHPHADPTAAASSSARSDTGHAADDRTSSSAGVSLPVASVGLSTDQAARLREQQAAAAALRDRRVAAQIEQARQRVAPPPQSANAGAAGRQLDDDDDDDDDMMAAAVRAEAEAAAAADDEEAHLFAVASGGGGGGGGDSIFDDEEAEHAREAEREAALRRAEEEAMASMAW